MTNWREIPFVRFVLPFMAGILLAVILDSEHPIFDCLLGVFLVAQLLAIFFKIPFRYRIFQGIITNGLLIFIGYAWCLQHHELRQTNHFENVLPAHFEGRLQKNFFIGKIKNTPPKNKSFKTLLEIQSVGNTIDSLQISSGNLLAYLKFNPNTPIPKYGDVIAFKTTPRKISSKKNPNAFDYRRFLHFKNIHYQSFVNAEDWQVLQSEQGNFILEKTNALQAHLLTILQKYLPTENELAVGNALILGYKEELSEDIRAAYARTGALHVLAVSGLHVGLVTGFVYFLLGFFYKSKKPAWRYFKMSLLLFVTWAFALVTGGSPSVLRAATMFTFLIIGLSMQRHTNIYNSLAISAACLLIYNPYFLMNVGFQLSYLAVLGIIFFQAKIYNLLAVKNRILDRAWVLVTVSMAAQLSTFPISLFYFHQFPMYFWLSGIIVIPAAMIILVSGLLLFAVHTIVPSVAFVFGTILYYAIWGMNQLIFLIEKMPMSVWLGIWISVGIMLLWYAAIGSVVITIRTKKLRWLLSTAGFALLIAVNFSFKNIEHFHQRKITIYHSYKNSMIDFFDGKEGFSICNPGISEKNLSFTTQNHRWAAGIKTMNQMYFRDLPFYGNNLLYRSPFIQFFDKKIAVVDDAFSEKAGQNIQVDFILLRKNPSVKIAEILKNFTAEKIICDASNSKWKVKKWKTECDALGIEIYDINENGAFELEW